MVSRANPTEKRLQHESNTNHTRGFKAFSSRMQTLGLRPPDSQPSHPNPFVLLLAF